MKITKPIDNFVPKLFPQGSITQWFGESPELYKKVCPVGAPCHPSMTCPTGTGCLIYHNGIDIVAPWGTPIYAVEGGTVIDVKNDAGGYGKHIRIRSKTDTGFREWVYGHASENLVVKGQRVVAGEMVQKMGNTGFVVSGATPFWKHNPYAGTHLHLGVRDLDKSLSVVNYNNGVFGCYDFKEMFEISDEEAIRRGLMLTVISLANQLISLLKKR
jgi:murein DD-endopeptidase MepM/ murein hydrolase activator NlpD